MVRINIEGHELEFEKKLVETFEYEVCDSFAESAKVHLMTNFHKENISEIFDEYTEQEIKDMIIKTSQMEIALCKGLL